MVQTFQSGNNRVLIPIHYATNDIIVGLEKKNIYIINFLSTNACIYFKLPFKGYYWHTSTCLLPHLNNGTCFSREKGTSEAELKKCCSMIRTALIKVRHVLLPLPKSSKKYIYIYVYVHTCTFTADMTTNFDVVMN